MRGRGYSRANAIVNCAKTSVVLKDGAGAGRKSIRWFAGQIQSLDEQLSEIEEMLHAKCREILPC